MSRTRVGDPILAMQVPLVAVACSALHPRKWSSSDSRSVSQFVANSCSSVSTPKRIPSIKNDNCCMQECGNSGIVMPYERQPCMMPFAVPTPIWYPQAPPPPAVPFCMGPLMSAPYSQYVLPSVKPIKKKQPDSPCSQMCCGGIAQLLWTIIIIVIMGMLAALILALVVI